MRAPALIATLLLSLAPAAAQGSQDWDGKYFSPELQLELTLGETAFQGFARVRVPKDDYAVHPLRVSVKGKALVGSLGALRWKRPIRIERASPGTITVRVGGKVYLLLADRTTSTGAHPVLAKVIQQARKQGALAALATPTYLSTKRGELVEVHSTLTDKTWVVRVQRHGPKGVVQMSQATFSAAGALVELRVGRGTRSDPNYQDGYRTWVEGGRFHKQNLTSKTVNRRDAWNDWAIPSDVALFVLPALSDLFPATGLTFRMVDHQPLIQSRPYRVDALRPDGSSRLWIYETAYRLEVQTKPDRRLLKWSSSTDPEVQLEAIAPARAKALLERLPSPAQVAWRFNRQRALASLRSLGYAQEAFQRRNRRFAVSLQELIDAKLWEPQLAHPVWRLKGYALSVRAGGGKWMAVASPLTPGKTGDTWFARNGAGKTRQSKRPIPLRDDCTTPDTQPAPYR